MEPVGPDKELINRAFRIKPVVGDYEGKLFFVEPVDLYEKLYTMEGLMRAEAADPHIEKIGEFEFLMPATLWGGPVGGPTIAQVLPQIPGEYLDRAVAFRAGMAAEHKGSNGFVKATCEVFSGELPENVKKQPVIAWNQTYAEPFAQPEAPKEIFNAEAAATLGQDITAMRPLALKKPAPKP